MIALLKQHRPTADNTAVSVRIIARKPTALGTQDSTAAIGIGDPW